jgi:phosphate starvation-inducible protein PhoH
VADEQFDKQRMTPKQRVQRKYSGAFSRKVDHEWLVFATNYDLAPIGVGKTVAAAWASAARAL